MSNTVIKVENLSKVYRLGEIGTGSIGQDVDRWFKTKVMGKEDPFLKIGETNDRASKGDSDIVYSLRDINFEIQQGDAVGIIGRNGAGKSTLLKILSRVTTPTTGKINIKGRVASLLEVGTGFHPELTGRENIFLNGAILGMRRREIDRKLEEIIDFSGVERYIDTPVKRYSSGMYVRLAFAVSAHLEPEVLIIDEVLAVGDVEFQKKALGRMKVVSEDEGRTVLFVSHDLNAIRSFCDKSILITNGLIQSNGNTNNVIAEYLQGTTTFVYQTESQNSLHLFFRRICVCNSDLAPTAVFDYTQDVLIQFEIGRNDVMSIHNGIVYIFFTIWDQNRRKVFSGETVITDRLHTVKLLGGQFTKGTYYLQALINVPQKSAVQILDDVVKFEILDNKSWTSKHGNYDCGSVFGNYCWL